MRGAGEVDDADHQVGPPVGVGPLAQVGQDVVVAVAGLDPLESAVGEVLRPQGRRAQVEAVEVADQGEQPLVAGIVQDPPVQGGIGVPLGSLTELLAHEQQLLAGVGPLVGVQGAQARQLLPGVAGHLGQQGALAVDDLIVAQRQDELLGEGVDEGEGQLAVVIAAVDRVLGQVAQGVVHPPHVPLQAEAQAAVLGGGGDARPRRGLLGGHDDAGVLAVGGGGGLLQEADGLQVLAAAELVGMPLAVLARVVQVEHGGHGVDAQTVGVELLEPVQGVGDQEVAHLVASEVEHVGAPVGVLAALRVGVLVQGGAVEAGQGPLVLGEVGRHPVQNDADAGLVELVHQVAEVVRGAEARGGRVVAGDLVAPGAAEGVLGHRQELHVGEAGLLDVGDQLLSQAAEAQSLAPRADVDLVDAHRPAVGVGGGALGHPLLVLPLVELVGDHRGGCRGDLGGAGHRVGLLVPGAVGEAELELVARTDPHTGHEQLPHSR